MSRGRAPSWSALVLAAAATLSLPSAGTAQVDLSGYVLTLATRSRASVAVPAATTALARGRIMADLTAGAFGAIVAYEHVATRSRAGSGFPFTTAGMPTGTDWLDADWEIWSSERGSWRHRFDRLVVFWSGTDVEVTLGRQAISWATTLFLTPADPFVPFDPSDPFRVYRAGVDAARIRYFPGPFAEVELVVRPADTSFGRTTTVLARAQASMGGWALGGWAGALHDEPAGAVFATGALRSTAVRSEVTAREGADGGAVVRAAVGVDRYFTPAGRDLGVLLEFQYDGFGAGGATDFGRVISSEPFLRGEMQTVSRWTVAAQATLQIHALIGVDALALVSLEDPSALVAPGLTWSASGDATVRAGLFRGLGSEGPSAESPASEYGLVPAIGYLSLTWFF